MYVGDPAIETPFVCANTFCSNPLHPNASNCTTAVLSEEPPVAVSPSVNIPFTLDRMTIVCDAVPPDVYAV